MAKKKTTPTSKALSNPMWELFCQYYVKNRDTWHNATRAYALANKIHLDSLSRDDAVVENIELSVGIFQSKVVKKSTYESNLDSCGASGKRLLSYAKVDERIKQLLRETLDNSIVDAEIAWMLQQREDLGPKATMIKEYNSMTGRTKTKVELTGANGERLFVPNGEEAQRVNSALDSLFGK